MNILSFGGGVQTTALAILAARKEVQVDAAIFADPGAEKPETYWYIEAYIKPLFKEAGIPFIVVPGIRGKKQLNLIEYIRHYRTLPSIFNGHRWCTVEHKILPIERAMPKAHQLIGFSVDEAQRKEHIKRDAGFPLLDLGLTGADCQHIISNYGWPIPVKSSCFFCPFQRWEQWNWLKINHPELIESALSLEKGFHDRRPDLKDRIGLFGGAPLWKFTQGIQMEMPLLKEYSCWSGACGH